jgi:hypothetical protein
MNSSGLLSALSSILYPGEAGLEPSWGGTMSLTVFLALCVLGLDFMIYALFQWTYGDKRNAVARQLAVHKNALKEQSRRPVLVARKRPVLDHKSQWHAGTSSQQT